MEPFFIENLENTCYIDSLLMALFYDNLYIDLLLNKQINDTMITYLQEYIKNNFITPIRAGKSILSNDMVMIRTLCSEIELINNKPCLSGSVTDFYEFLVESLNIEKIKLKTLNLPYISLTLPSQNVIKINNLVTEWSNNNNINNCPEFIGLSLNRADNLDSKVIIQKKIKFNNNTITSIKWEFHAAICNKYKINHYYTLFSTNNKWYLFDDLMVPCIKEVKMDDVNVVSMIKTECVFLLYKLPKFTY